MSDLPACVAKLAACTKSSDKDEEDNTMRTSMNGIHQLMRFPCF